MAVRKWNEFRIPYEQAVEELKVKFKSIRREYRRKNENSPIEFVTGRVKELSSMLEKANKFNIPIDRVEYELEDIAGIRIMCQFVDDIYRVVDLIRKRKDMQIIYEKDYITDVKASGYRSYHIIVKYPVNMADGVKEILAEFQIRTLAMNFWATVEHSLNYKYKHKIPEEIKDEIMDAQKLFEVKSSLVSDIMNNIFALISSGRTVEADCFQNQLNDVVSEGEVFELNNLLKATERSLKMYK